MNMFQRINVTASFLVLGALVTAFASAISQTSAGPFTVLRENVDVALLSVFIVFFKVKSMLDDHQHFGEPHQNKDGFRHVGFLLALLSWMFWALAAYIVFSPARAAELMIVSIALSMLWLGVHVIEILVDKQRRNREIAISLMREKWALFNVGYVLALGVYLGWLDPVIPAEQYLTLLLLLGLFLLDYLSSRSYPTSIG